MSDAIMPRHLFRTPVLDFLEFWFTARILEPRGARIIQAAMYLSLALTGILLGTVEGDPPRYVLINAAGWFMFAGALVAAPVSLGGVWWLERIGILSLTTGLLMYLAALLLFGGGYIGGAVGVAITLSLVQRWYVIRKFMSAPRVLAADRER